ncbi:hypothetical protein [Leptolyngbya sp. AN10]|uniref:hypothetical protein n=1 Tax=Leptolyngbya sp. AN10 TaxID=3423365 RepID=UPI003D314E38
MHFIKKASLSAIAIATLSVFPQIANAKPPGSARIPDSSASCESAIASVKSSLVQRGYFIPWKSARRSITPQVVFDNNGIRNYFYDYPTERTQILTFRLSGDGTRLYQGLMSSPQLMATMSAQIMASCDRVGLVEFAHWHEGYVPVGYFPDRTARTFTWTDLDENSPHQRWIKTSNGSRITHQWGYYFSP